MKYIAVTLVFALGITGFACSDDDNPTDGGNGLNGTEFQTSNIKTKPSLIDLETGTVAEGWDLKFTLNGPSPDIALNSGTNGPLGVSISNLGAVDFETAHDSSAMHFAGDSTGMMAIGDGWYNYDFTTHTMSPKGEVYIFKCWDYTTVKMTVTDYTNSKFYIKYAVKDGDTWGTTVVDSIGVSADAPAYYQLSSGTTLSEPADWDIGFLTILILADPETNFYIRNPGAVLNSVNGAKGSIITGIAFEDLFSVPVGTEFSSDSPGNLAFGDHVFEYKPEENHLVDVRDEVYLVESTEGTIYKIKLISYYEDPEIPLQNSGFVTFNYEALP